MARPSPDGSGFTRVLHPMHEPGAWCTLQPQAASSAADPAGQVRRRRLLLQAKIGQRDADPEEWKTEHTPRKRCQSGQRSDPVPALLTKPEILPHSAWLWAGM